VQLTLLTPSSPDGADAGSDTVDDTSAVGWFAAIDGALPALTSSAL